jgi:hypothetical protein
VQDVSKKETDKEYGFNKIQNLTPATHPLSVYGEGNKRGEVPKFALYFIHIPK